MKKVIRGAVLVLACMLVLTQHVAAQTDNTPYSYTYDANKNALPGPAPFEAAIQIDTQQLGVGRLTGAQGLFVRDDRVYICDTGNDRILELSIQNDTVSLVRQIKECSGQMLKQPYDVYVSEDGDLYIADYGNQRVLCTDKDLQIRMTLTAASVYGEGTQVAFKPQKLAVASGGHIYVQAQGINEGLINFDSDGNFASFFGASPVKFDWADYMWKVFSTDAQKAQMAQFVPTEYNNVTVDDEGFLFVTTAVFSDSELMNGQAQPLRRLNLKGNNILIENDPNWYVMGDVVWDQNGSTKFVDVAALSDGTYYALDKTRCHIFRYDEQGNFLYAFSGRGSRAGYFQNPVAIEDLGSDLLVLDSASNYITLLRETRYGALISEAIHAYDSGEYDLAYEKWSEVLALNGNYAMAYRGIGRILLRKGQYREALDYLEYAEDAYYYSKAWKLYRKDMIEEYLFYAVGAVAAVAVTVFVVKKVQKLRQEVREYAES